MSVNAEDAERDFANIRKLFLLLLNESDKFSANFYSRLFKTAPEVEQMITRKLTLQRELFVATLTTIVNSISHLDDLDEFLSDLGKNHRGFGIEAAHFKLFREALIGTMREMLGEKLDAKTEAAWERLMIAVSLKIRLAMEE